jgi:hypothetical protein
MSSRDVASYHGGMCDVSGRGCLMLFGNELCAQDIYCHCGNVYVGLSCLFFPMGTTLRCFCVAEFAM